MDSPEYEQAVADRIERERIGRETKEREAMRDLVRAFSNVANRSTASKLFVEEMSYEHRTLQQVMTGMMLAWFTHLAGLTGAEYDLRNEASVHTARKIVEATGGVTRLPLI